MPEEIRLEGRMITLPAGERRALKAGQAGEYLAKLLGLPCAVSAQKMWRLARADLIPSFRLGREVWFQTDSLEAFCRTEQPKSASRIAPRQTS